MVQQGNEPAWSHYVQCGYKDAFLLNNSPCNGNISSEGIPMNAVVTRNIPFAAGLSSSSALGVASTVATLYCQHCIHFKSSPFQVNKYDDAQMARYAEQYIGTMGGGMDQAISCLGQGGAALLIHFHPSLR